MGLSGVSRERRRALRVCLPLDVRGPTGGRVKLKQDENGEVTFADVLDALVQRTYKAVDLDGATDDMQPQQQRPVATTVPSMARATPSHAPLLSKRFRRKSGGLRV